MRAFPARPSVAARLAARLACQVASAGLVASLGLGPLAAGVLAHGEAGVGPPDATTLLFAWTFDPLPAVPLLTAVVAWLVAVRRVDRAHPDNPVPRLRTAAFLAGIGAIAVALMSGIERYDTVLFSVHMVQHILLSLVAAPLLALAAPITLLLRAVSSDTRRQRVLPLLHSRAVRALSFPVVAGLLFAGVMWAAHFSPLFDLALEDPLAHDVEHALFLGTALLFWWPAVGADPSPWRMSHPIRAMYVFLQMPQNTFLAVAILSAPAPLYAHYATVARDWGPTPLADQQAAAGIMWLVGDVLFLGAILLLVAAWMRNEERRTAIEDRRADAARALIREREAGLATRLAEGLADERQPGRGVESSSR